MRLARLFGLATPTALAFGILAAPAADTPKSFEELRKEYKQKLDNAKTPAQKEQIRAEIQKLKEKFAAKAAAKPAKPAEVAKPAVAAAPTPAPVPVKPAKPADPAALNPTAVAKLIDTEIAKQLAEAKVPASPKADDAEFLRRAYLDITGVIPTAEQAKAFLDSPAADKRAKLIDELLASPNYGRVQADYWTAKFFVKDSANRFVLKEPFYDWFQKQFNENVPWNQFVTNLVTATGTVDKNPEVTFFLSNRSVDKLTDQVSANFLGIQLQCAQCHNHPFTGWKQTEYWGMAAFFSKTSPQNPRNTNKGGDNSTIGVSEGNSKTKLKDFFPEATKDVPAKYLGGAEPPLASTQPYRPVLASWMTSPENPFFAKAAVNRTWAHYFGRGFVNPIDDMHEKNPASHPDLLNGLAAKFAAGGFDMKQLIRGICLSDAYQRTSKPVAGNEDDEELFSHMTVKVMTPEQLYDSLGQVAGGDSSAGRAKKAEAAGAQRAGGGPREQFVNFFLAGAESASTVEYEVGIPQALRLMNSNRMTNPTAAKELARSGAKPAEVIEKLYLGTLSRRPTAAETARLTAYIGQQADAATAYADITWALLNSSEFTMVR